MKIMIAILMLTCFLFVNAQNLSLKGRIISEDLEGIPEAKITNQKNESVALFKGTCFRTGKPLISA